MVYKRSYQCPVKTNSRNYVKMRQINNVLLAMSLLLLTSTSSAALLKGVIKFGGDLTFDFTTNSVDIIGNDAVVVNNPSGDFASFADFGDLATYNDFNYDPLSISPAGPLWSVGGVGGLTFSLSQITYISELTDPQGNQYLNLAGNGVFSADGFDPTSGAWTFSADTVGGSEFTFSSTNVPEPGIALLLGVGLIGVGASRKFRKKV